MRSMILNKSRIILLYILLLLSLSAHNLEIPFSTISSTKAISDNLLSSVFGYEKIGSITASIEDIIQGSLFKTESTGGKADSITVALRCGSTTWTGKVKAAIVLHANLSLVGSTQELNLELTTSPTWYTFNFDTKPNLNANTEYILCVWSKSSDGSALVCSDSGNTNQGHRQSHVYDSWPNLLGTMTHSVSKLSIYCNYSQTGDGTEPGADWLHTDGKYIKNKFNQKIFLRGVTFGDLVSKFAFSIPEYRITQLMSLTNHQANVIRCPISPAPAGDWSGWTNPEKFDKTIDQFVNLCVKYNVYMVIEMHGIRNSLVVAQLKADPSPWINWLLHFVNRYKGVPNVVGFEIWNEPAVNLFTQAEWRTLATKAYNEIRKANPKALIIISSVPFTEISQDWINHPMGPQAVYSWDSYYSKYPYTWYRKPYDDGDYVTGKARMQNLLYNLKHINASLPIIDTEFGWLPTDNLQACRDYYELLNQAENNWYTWWWHENPVNLGLCLDKTYTALSPHGEIMRNYLGSYSP